MFPGAPLSPHQLSFLLGFSLYNSLIQFLGPLPGTLLPVSYPPPSHNPKSSLHRGPALRRETLRTKGSSQPSSAYGAGIGAAYGAGGGPGERRNALWKWMALSRSNTVSSGSSERKSSIFPSVASFTHWLMFSRSSPFLPVRLTGFAPKSCSDCSRKSSLMGNPMQKGPQVVPRDLSSRATNPQTGDLRPTPSPSPLSTQEHYRELQAPTPTFLQVHSGSQSECPRAQVLAKVAQ